MGPRTKIKSNQARKLSGKADRPSLKKLLEKPAIVYKENNLPFYQDDDVWSPNMQTVFKALASARLCAAVWNNINDCDETYNYWEPLHYLVYGSGFQTWEYSPEFALRSYTYLAVHALPAWLYGLILQSNRILVFYFLRCVLGFVCTTFETFFYKGIVQEFGPKVGRMTLAFLLFSAGMFQASSALLPSSFSMYMCLLSMGSWFHQQYPLAILSTALSAFLSWPFAGAIGVGIAFDLLLLQGKLRLFATWCVISIVAILVPIIAIDSFYYGRFVVAPLNIVLYNVFSDHGPDLYGTSPWTFYFLNGFLNFNVVFPLALAALPTVALTQGVFKLKAIKSRSIPLWLALVPLYVWILIFFTQPHKEERFLFPIYPLIGFAAAMTWACVESCLRALKMLPGTFGQWLTLVLLVSSSTISISRVVGQYKGFHAPMDVFLELNRLSWENDKETTTSYNICTGKEWHRFPSSFFLPNNWKLLYLKSDFAGQLPLPFDPSPNGTRTIPANMNDLNREEPSRYASLKDCHYLVDLETSHVSEQEPRFSEMSAEWEVIFRIDFLDSLESPQLLRAFYIPWFSETYCRTLPYVLLKRRTPLHPHPTKQKKWK